MRFHPPLQSGRLIKRYKRFLADIELSERRIITAHTPNTGAMLGCAEPGQTVWVRDTQAPHRKYPYSWDMSETADGKLIGVHTGWANTLVKEAIASDLIEELQGYSHIKTEPRIEASNSRLDLLLETESRAQQCYIEIKNVTASVDGGLAIFPDAPTLRGQKHLNILASLVELGQRAVLVFCVQREDIHTVRPAKEIDPRYAEVLKAVIEKGVEVIAYGATLSASEVILSRRLVFTES